MYEMHVIISHQQVIFTDLISFYKFFNDMYFTHVILLLGQMWVGTQNKEWYQRTIHRFIPESLPNRRHGIIPTKLDQ